MTSTLENALADLRKYGYYSDNMPALAQLVVREMSMPGVNWTEALAAAFQAVADAVNKQRDEDAFYASLTEPY